MGDNDDNVISIDFGKQRRGDESFGDAVRRDAKPELARAAKQRGYSPDRVDELADIIGATVNRMFACKVQTTIKTDPGLDDQAFATEVANAVGKQVAQHCASEFMRAVVTIAYPIGR